MLPEGTSIQCLHSCFFSISSFKRKRSNSPCRNLPPVVIQNRSRVEHLILDGNLLTENALNMPVFPRLKSLSLQRNKVTIFRLFTYSVSNGHVLENYIHDLEYSQKADFPECIVIPRFPCVSRPFSYTILGFGRPYLCPITDHSKGDQAVTGTAGLHPLYREGRHHRSMSPFLTSKTAIIVGKGKSTLSNPMFTSH